MAIAVILPCLNWLLTSAVFWVLTRRFGRIGAGEMSALIGAAGLLNYLPLRPGLFGRIAWHRRVNGIPITDSFRVLVANIACCGAAVGLGLAAALAFEPLGRRGAWLPYAAAVLPAVLSGAAAAVLTRPIPAAAWILAAVSLRYLDLLAWTARYAVVFAIAGSPVSAPGALALACVAQAAMLIPLSGNGLGLREWAIGLTAGVLPTGVFISGEAATGIAADLFNRAAELVVAVPIGLASAAWLARRYRRVTGTPGSGPSSDVP